MTKELKKENLPLKIIHFGDIHSFRNKRFHEHKYLFNEFDKDLKKEKPDLIVITGDVVDSKINISPEQVQLVTYLFKICLKHSDVILIPGNHDLNLQNKSRVDILSVIHENLISDSNIEHEFIYWKESKIYQYKNLDWAVWSCIEDQKNPFGDKEKNDGYTIGLFHGAVKGCIADNGFRLTSGTDISEFSLCNLVMMSDIHMQQSFRNNEVVYSGSFIQSKDNESPNGTYLIHNWNDKKKKYEWEVKEIVNPFSVLTINVNEEGEYELPKNIDKSQTIKLEYDRKLTSKSTLLEIKKELQSKLPNNKIEAKPVIVNRKNKKEEDKEEITSSSNTEEILLKFLKNNKEDFKISDIDLTFKEILKIDSKYDADIQTETTFEEGDYQIERLIVNNLFSFGPEDQDIEIPQEGIVGIGGPNAIGKSSILKIISFILFEDVPKNTTSFKKIINKFNRDKDASGELIINKEGKKFYIKRSISPKKKGDGVSFELEFNEIDEDFNIIQELNGEKKQETQKNILKYFATEDMFGKLSLFSAQKKQTEYIDCTNSERLLLVSQFLGLQNYDQKYKLVNDDIKTDKKVYDEKSKDFDKELDLESLQTELEGYEEDKIKANKNIQVLEKEIASEKDELQQINDLINKQKAIALQKYKKVSDIENEITGSQSKIERYSSLRENKNSEIKEVDEKMNICKEKLEELLKEIESCDKNTLKHKKIVQDLENKFFEKYEQKWDEYRSIYDKENLKFEKEKAVIESEVTKSIKQLQIDTCNSCGKEFTEEDKIKVKTQINDYKEKIQEFNDLISKNDKLELGIQKEIKNIKDQKNTLKTFEGYSSQATIDYNNKARQLKDFENEYLKIDNKYLQFESDIKQLELNLVKLKEDKIISLEIEDQIEIAKGKIEKLNQDVDPINARIKERNDNINNFNLKLGTYNEKIKNIKLRQETYKKRIFELKKLEESLYLLNIYKKVVNKDGLPLFLLKEKVQDVNQEVNLIANQVFNFDLLFNVDEEAGELNLEFIYDGDNENNDVSLASGSETFIINLCIKVGLAQLSLLPKMKTLMIDEGFDSLDKTNIDKLPDLFNSLLNYYNNIILISHLDELKDCYTNVLMLEKTGKYTKVLI